MDRINDGYRQLASSVLNLAIEDRKKALRKLEIDSEDKKAEETLKDCDSFFSSKRCALLLDFLNIERETFLEAVYGR